MLIRYCIPAVLFFSLLFTGCGYRFAGSQDNTITAGQVVWIEFIANETSNPTAQSVVRRMLYEESHALRGLVPAHDEKSTDFIVTGNIPIYSVAVASFNPLDQAREYRVTLGVYLELKRPYEKTPVWKGTIVAVQDYPVMGDSALQYNASEAAFASAARKIAQKFIAAVEQSY